jgi:hypothetical protein
MRTLGMVSIALVVSAILSYVGVYLRIPILPIALPALTVIAVFISCTIRLTRSVRSGLGHAVLKLTWVLGFVPALVIAFWGSTHIVNSWRLSLFAHQIIDNPPPQAVASLQSTRVGVLTGNGDHCDFIVEVELTGDFDESNVLEHYTALPIVHAVPGSHSEIQIHAIRDASSRYIVRVTDAPNGAGFDIRCS